MGKVKGHIGPTMRSMRGRAGVFEWWRGIVINTILSVWVGAFPITGPIMALLFTYAGIAVTTRRLHDLGVSGWLQLAPILLWAAMLFAASLRFGPSGQPDLQFDAALQALFSTPTAPGSLGLFVAIAVWLVFMLLMGSVPGNRGPNAYGEAD